MGHFIDELINRYPQLLMPIEKGIKNSEEYRNIVLRGEPCNYKDTFKRNKLDKFETIDTPLGEVEVLMFYDREDFVHAVRSLGNRCEPVAVPDSIGAEAIFGLNNWQKVRAGLDDYKDSLIILSYGNYSNVPYEKINETTLNEYCLNNDTWLEKSLIIRKYHELTHFVMRKKYPNDIKPIRDEIIADSVGIIGAFKCFDDRLLKLFLGIEGDVYRKGGRLENYEGLDTSDISSIINLINNLKDKLNNNIEINDIWKNIERYM